MDKPYRPVQHGVSMWSSPSILPPTQHSREFRKALSDESKIANQLRNTASAIKKAGKVDLRADSFTSLLREELPAYPVYIPPRQKTLSDMSVEELFELARHFRRSKRSQNDIVGSGAYDNESEAPRYKVMDREKEKRRLQSIMLFGREAVDIPSEVKTLERPPSAAAPPDEFDQLIDEIQERQDFLEQMKSMGRDSFYKENISLEVIEILNRMKLANEEKYNRLMEQADKDWSATAYHSVLKNNIY